MPLADLSQVYLPAVEDELQRAVAVGRAWPTAGAADPALDGLYAMLAYHMGWEGEGAGPEARGKRIRPLLVLLTCAAAGGEWRAALPAAAAVELVHNFSLIHDDIEDNSPLRRGRPTLWKLWGLAQATNAGDCLFTLAHLSTLRLAETASSSIALAAVDLIQRACLHLTQGQYLDIGYETRRDLRLEAYWPMIGGKTAALLEACAGLGALIAGADLAVHEHYRIFSRSLGLAFQIQDDILGIWGDAALTGKSAESDLTAGKKSFPVLYALGLDGAFASRWRQGPLAPEEVPALAAQLAAEGARAAAQETANRLTTESLQALQAAQPQGEAGLALLELAQRLLQRQA